MAAKLVVEPSLRGGLSAVKLQLPSEEVRQALQTIGVGRNQATTLSSSRHSGYVDNIKRDTRMKLVKERLSDPRVLKQIRQRLDARVMEDGMVRETLARTPQAARYSPNPTGNLTE